MTRFEINAHNLRHLFRVGLPRTVCESVRLNVENMAPITYSTYRAFSIYKKIRKFSIGNFRLGKRVPFVTSPILWRPGRLIDRERHGTGDKDNKSVNGTREFSIGKFPPGKRDYLFRNSVYSGKFPVERTKKSCSIYNPTGISGIFW